MILNKNEIILKEILPRKGFFFNITEKIRIVFSFFYLAVSIIFLFKMTSFFFIFALAMFASALYITLLRWIIRYYNIKNKHYVITNQRIIIANNKNKEIKKHLYVNKIDQVNVEMSNQFFGNIIFGEPENIFGKNNEPFSFFNRNGMNFNEDKYVFLSVEGIDQIIPIFEKLDLKINKTFY